jgi:chromosome partitioning protein
MVQSSALEKVGPELLTLYEVAEYDGDRRTLERAIDAMNSVNGEVEMLIRRALQAAAIAYPAGPVTAEIGEYSEA